MRKGVLDSARHIRAKVDDQLISAITYIQSDPDSISDHFDFRRSAESTRIGLRQDAKNVAGDFQKAMRKFEKHSED